MFKDYAPHPRRQAYTEAFGSFSGSQPGMHTNDYDEIDHDPHAAMDEDDINPADGAPYEHQSQPQARTLTVCTPRGTVRPRSPSVPGTVDDEPPTHRTRLSSNASSGEEDSDANLAEPEFNGTIAAGKTPLRGDYIRAVQEVLDYAVTLYKAKLTAENAYPDKLTERTWAKAAWKESARELDIPLKYHSTIIPLVSVMLVVLRASS